MNVIERVAEVIAGALIALVTLVILVVGGLFSVGSMGKYLKNKAM